MKELTPLFTIFGYSLLGGIVISYLKSIKRKPKNWLTEIVVNFLGSLFIFSGFVKAIDPLGTAYKMKDYFDAFSQFTGVSFQFLAKMSTFLAVTMIVLEIVLGVALIIGFKKKITLGLSAAIMVFFTILTGFTYLTGYINPDFYDITMRHELKAAGEHVPVFVEFDKLNMKVTDCGCFGDFLKLEPVITFSKDVVLLFVLAFIFIRMKDIQQFFGKSFSWLKIGGTTFFFLLFCFSNYIWGLPMVDFRPYKVGNDINELRIEIPDKLEYGFVFENVNTGEEKRVIMSEYADYKANPDWEFTDKQDNIVLEKGVEATINNFAVFDDNGFDLTDDILHNENYSFWVLMKDMKKVKAKNWKDLNVISAYADANQLEMFGFMTLAFDEAEEIRHENQVSFPVYQADETFIKTVVRSNPGLVVLKNGIVQAKYHHKNFPNQDELNKLLAQ